MKLTVTLLL